MVAVLKAMTALPLGHLHAGLLALLLMVCVSTGCKSAPTSEAGLELKQVIIGHKTYNLELAMDDTTRFQGLSDRKSIARDGGMLFVFPQPRQLNFVMRRCLIPIDLIYLGPGGRIVSMHQMHVEPYDTPEHQLKYYSSGWPAQFAIELREGSIDELGLKVGQKIELPLSDLKAAAR